MHDRTDDEVEAGGAERLLFERPITNFTPLVEKDGALQLMRSLTLIETGLAPSS